MRITGIQLYEGVAYCTFFVRRSDLNRSLVRRLAIGVFLLNLLAVTWPVASFFRSPEPMVFALPLSMAWPIAWILIGFVMLLVLDYSENRDEGE